MPLERFFTRTLQCAWRFSRGLTLHVRGVVPDNRGHVLLVRDHEHDRWQLPGGLATHGESATAALRRLLLEQAGLVLHEPPQLVGICAEFESSPETHVVLLVVRNWTAARTDIAELRFLAADMLPGILPAEYCRRIAAAVGNR